MLVKFKLNINGSPYELAAEDLKNWADVKCTYKRADYGGIVRSFMSKFEFVGTAYDLLLTEYDRAGVFANATIEMWTIGHDWNYNLEFWCELDFSTLSYTATTLSINAVDNSNAAKIKATKSVKYEFKVGEEMPVAETFVFDRLEMLNSVTYAVTDGESQDDGSLVGSYQTPQQGRIYIGRTNMEIAVGGALITNEDQTNDPDGYLFQVSKKKNITFECDLNIDRSKGCGRLVLMRTTKSGLDIEVKEITRAIPSIGRPLFSRNFSDVDQLLVAVHANPTISYGYAHDELDGEWVVIDGIVWVFDHGAPKGVASTGRTLDEYSQCPVRFTHIFMPEAGDKVWIKFDSATGREFSIYKSAFKFAWRDRGLATRIDAIRPEDLLEGLLAKMGVELDVYIDKYFDDQKNCYLLAAESVRGLEGAKIYASFNDFCDWMETVFGYVYYIDDDSGILVFKHRGSLFSASAPIVDIPVATDFEISTDKSMLASSIVVGYNKQEYEGPNGRDEFNFNSAYTTGYTQSDKKIELKSPFRADSYGIEFLVEKRGEDTTDNASDKTVFFVHTEPEGFWLKPNRKASIGGSMTGTLMNAAYAPRRCLAVNIGYLAMMFAGVKRDPIEIKFASTEGNPDITINKVPVTADAYFEDIDIYATPLELKFTTGDLAVPEDINSAVRVKFNGCYYEGFIRELTLKYAHEESAEYTIIVRSKTPCS